MIRNLLFALFVICSFHAVGQFYKTVLPSAGFSSALEKILLDFRYDYRNIQGNKVDNTGDMDIFKSSVMLPGVSSATIQRFHSKLDTTANWQGIVYTGDDYKAAVRAYQNMFRMLKKCQVSWIDRSKVEFAGDLEQPREELRFTTSVLNLNIADTRYENFRALVQLSSTYDGWEVQVNLNKKTL